MGLASRRSKALACRHGSQAKAGCFVAGPSKSLRRDLKSQMYAVDTAKPDRT